MKKFVRRLRRLFFPALRRDDLLDVTERAAAIDFVYRFVLARPVDEEGRAHYLRRMDRVVRYARARKLLPVKP